MTATGNRGFLRKTSRGRLAVLASISLLVLLLLGDVATAISGTDDNSTRLAQVADQSVGTQTNSQNAQSGPQEQPASAYSEPAEKGGRPSDHNSPNRPSAPQKEFKPSEEIDVDKAVDFPVDI